MPAVRKKDKSHVNKKLVERYYAAWNTLNAGNAASFYAKDAGLAFFDVMPFQYRGWTQYKKGVQKHFFDNISAGKLMPYRDLKITRRAGVAWMTLTFCLSFTLKSGKRLRMDCRHTAIWERRRGKWLIVHEHISAPLPG
jgi:ketosteroid isomerase-like protein